jgi:hypothetical protein
MKDFQKALEENIYLGDSFLFDEKLLNVPVVECGEKLVTIPQKNGNTY